MRTHTIVRSTIASAAALLLLPLAACAGGGSSDDEIPTIRLASIPTSGQVISHVLIENPAELGLEGFGTAYELEITQANGAPDVIQGLASDAIDAGPVGATAIFPLFEQGVDVRVLGEYFEEKSGWLSPSWMVRADSDINSIEDLRGKRVGVNSVGGALSWIATSALRSAGLEPDQDYQFVAVEFAGLLDALANDQVDVAPVVPPWLGRAQESGDFRELFNDNDVLDPFVQGLLVFRQSFIDEHEDAVKAFLADWAKAAEFTRDPANHDVVIEAVSAVTKTPVEHLGYVATKDFYFLPERGAPNVDAIQHAWDWMHELGAVDTRYQVEDYLQPDLLP